MDEAPIWFGFGYILSELEREAERERKKKRKQFLSLGSGRRGPPTSLKGEPINEEGLTIVMADSRWYYVEFDITKLRLFKYRISNSFSRSAMENLMQTYFKDELP